MINNICCVLFIEHSIYCRCRLWAIYSTQCVVPSIYIIIIEYTVHIIRSFIIYHTLHSILLLLEQIVSTTNVMIL